jgi:threonine dehydrogenase-like Zn-dependent dehydrogenase
MSTFTHYDIIIIGTGPGGGTLAYKLAPSGKKILLLERGGYLPREKDNWSSKTVFIDNKYKAKETWKDKDGGTFHPGIHYSVGGNSKVYGAVLLEPASIIEKGIIQAHEAQRRFKVWRPKKAAVLGAGTVGLLAALSLKMKGFDVTSFGKESRPSRNLDLLEELGVRYISTNDLSIREAAKRFGPFDLMFEATGYSPVVFEAMECLGKNGVLVLASVTGGDREHSVPADKINLDFVLGNKLVVGTVNANREYFEAGVYDFARAELEFPGWLPKLLTHPVTGLENYQEMMQTLMTERSAIKVYVNVAYD